MNANCLLIKLQEGERERDRQTDREKERERDRQTDRHKSNQKNKRIIRNNCFALILSRNERKEIFALNVKLCMNLLDAEASL